jgi:tRNA G18 (ribose-2'-O)-methylase SpoU
MSGYFEIGIYCPKSTRNVGTLWRSAFQLGAAGIFTIGRRYDRTITDCYDAANNIPLRQYDTVDEFFANLPAHASLVGIEMGGVPLPEFVHPRNTVYLLGADDRGLPPSIKAECQQIVSLQAIRQPAYNVAVAGSIVLYHRVFFQHADGAHRDQGLHPEPSRIHHADECGVMPTMLERDPIMR